MSLYTSHHHLLTATPSPSQSSQALIKIQFKIKKKIGNPTVEDKNVLETLRMCIEYSSFELYCTVT